MKEYELTVLINPDLEADIESSSKKIKDLVTSNGGEIVSEENLGKKRLAYKIKNQDFAVYLYFDVKLPAEAPLKIGNVLNITDEALRYLLVKVDERARKALEEAKNNESEDDSKKE